MSCKVCDGNGQIVKDFSQQPGSYITSCFACKPTQYGLFRPGVPNSPMMKDADYFIEQGGLTEEWGKNWEPIYDCATVGEARRKFAKSKGVTLSHIYLNEP